MTTLDDIILLQGDCLQLMKDIPSGSVDMILCDLPYGTTACRWDTVIPFEPLWEQYERVIKDNGAILLFSAQPFTSKLVASNLNLFKYEWIWKKTLPKGHLNAKKMPMRAHENIEVFYKKLPTYNPQMTHGHNRKVAKTKYIRNSDGNSCYGKEIRDTFYDSTERYPLDVQEFSNGDQSKKSPSHASWFWGLGYWTRANAELCLIATKGKPKRVSKSVHQVCDARIMEHSKKPDEIRERIVKLCGDVPRIELFARKHADGWDCWGNEV